MKMGCVHENLMSPRHLSLAGLLLSALALAAPPLQWESRGIGGGGALYSPSFSPHNDGELYIACDMGDLFHSTDLGASWNIVDFRSLQSFHYTLVQFTNDPSVLYTIDYAYAGQNAARPTRSSDAGSTWTPVSGWPVSRRAFNLFADPGSSDKLLVTTATQLYFSNDGGNSFSLKYTDASGNGLVIGGAFFDGEAIYAGTNTGLLVSSDGGNSFALRPLGGMSASEGIFSFAGAKQAGVTRLFALTVDSSRLSTIGRTDALTTEDVYGGYRGVYSLDWGQPAWSAKKTGIVPGDQPALVAMARNDISSAYLAGRIAPIGSAMAGAAPVVYKTSNAGSAWQNVFLVTNNQNITTGWTGQGGDMGGNNWWWGNTPLGLAVAPNDANKLTVTDKGGVPHLSTDGGANWHQIYTDRSIQHAKGVATPARQYYLGAGLEPTLSLWLAWADASNLFAGYADIAAIRSKDGGNSWGFDYSGLQLLASNGYYNYSDDVLHISQNYANGTLYAGLSNGLGSIYQAIGLTDSRIDIINGAIRYSLDKGLTWVKLHDFNSPVVWTALDPNNQNRMYASVANSSQGGIYRTDNLQSGASSTWVKTSNPPRTEGHPYNVYVLNDGAVLATFSGRINASGAFTQSSGVFISYDAGNTWLDRSDPGMLYYTKNVTVDPGDSSQNTWYVGTFSNWGGNNIRGGLFKTTNRGTTWTKIITASDVHSVTINPQDASEMYVATGGNGLWFSSNANTLAPIFSVLSAYPFAQPQRVFFNPHNLSELWVTSNGNGLRVGSATSGGVVEFYNAKLDNYFITADASEAAAIDNGSAGAGWSRTGNTFKSGGSTAVCRFYGSLSPGPNSHFYTADPGECGALKALQASTPATQPRWNFESNDFLTTVPVNGTCSAGTTPVYRAYNNGSARGVDSNHRINSLTAIQQVVARGWSNEGVVMCAPI